MNIGSSSNIQWMRPLRVPHICFRSLSFLLNSLLKSRSCIKHRHQPLITARCPQTTYQILLQLLDPIPKPVIVDIHSKVIRVPVSHEAIPVASNGPALPHHHPGPFWVLGSGLFPEAVLGFVRGFGFGVVTFVEHGPVDADVVVRRDVHVVVVLRDWSVRS